MRNCAIEFFVKRIVLAAFGTAAVVCGGSKHPQSAPQGEGAAFVRAASTDLSRAIEGNRPYQLGADEGRALPVDASDVARGYRLVEEATEAVSYAMPEDGVEVGNWHKRGTFGEWLRYELGWGFPHGSNDISYSSFAVFNDAKIRPTPRDRSHEICAVGVPMLAMQGRSRFWVADGSGGETTLTWENFYLDADTNTPINAQIVLCENGDFVTRSNAVARYYARIDPNDWDGDGLANEIDAEPYTNGGDCFGTGEGWWAANAAAVAATNANPEAYYWLEFAATRDKTRVAVTCDGASDLGDMIVIARTNQVCRVPLLVGARYAVRASEPLTGIVTSDENAVVSFNDDVRVSAARSVSEPYQGDWGQSHPSSDFASQSSSRGLLRPLRGSRFAFGQPARFAAGASRSSGDTVPLRDSATGRDDPRPSETMGRVEGNAPHRAVAWGRASADFSIDYPLEFFFVPPPVGSGSAFYALDSEPVDVGAVLASLSGGCCTNVVAADGFSWVCAADCGCGGASSGGEGRVRYEGYEAPFWWWNACGCRYESATNGADAASIGLSVVDTVFVNDDDPDESPDDDLVPVAVSWSGCSEAATGTLRLTVAGSGLRLWDSREKSRELPPSLTFADVASPFATNLWLEATAVSGAYRDKRVGLEWADAPGGRHERSRLLTAVEPIVEPILSVRELVDGYYGVVNPCVLVRGGRRARFRMGLLPGDYPDGRIRWTCDGSGVSFAGGATGREVEVRADATATDGAFTIRVGDAVSAPPMIPYAARDLRRVKVRTVYTRTPQDYETLSRYRRLMGMAFAGVNGIWSQAAVQFVDVGSVEVYCPSRVEMICGDEGSLNQLVALTNFADSVTCYVVDEIVGAAEFTRSADGVVVLPRSLVGDAKLLAHELGHVLGLADIYDVLYEGSTETLFPGVLAREHVSGADWNNGGGNARYYTPGLTQGEVIRRLVMSGITDRLGCDIPSGPVMGSRLLHISSVGWTNVGESSLDFNRVKGFEQERTENDD